MITSIIHKCKFGYACISTQVNYNNLIEVCGVQLGSTKREVKQNTMKLFSIEEKDILDEIDSLKDEIHYIVHLDVLDSINTGKEFNLPIRFITGTYFQQLVWSYLTYIPFGKTLSYKKIAEIIGSPKAYRAVANSCAANPMAIIIPCHRVIRSDGRIDGYRWGNDIKTALLKRENQL